AGLAGAGPSTGPAGAATGPHATPLGTVAEVNGTIIAGGDARVRAKDDIKALALTGSIAAGAVGIGASIEILNIDGHTEASVTGTGSISAGSASTDVVEVAAITTEDTDATAFGGAAGAVAVGGQVVVLKSDVDQRAHIDTGAKIPQAGGGVFVTGSATRTVKSLSIGAGIGAVAVGASISLNTTSGDTKAEIGNVAVGTDVVGGGAVRGIDVEAYGDIKPKANSFSV